MPFYSKFRPPFWIFTVRPCEYIGLDQNVFKTSSRRLENVLKTYDQDEYIGLDQDVFKTSWRRKAKANIFVLIKTSWRRLEDVFWSRRRKTSSRHLQDVFIKTNVCWVRPMIVVRRNVRFIRTYLLWECLLLK